MLRRALLALLLVTPALAQDPPPGEPLERRSFRIREPFHAGEVWLLCTGARARLAQVDRAPVERSIAWTHSAVVLARPDGFALRATLTSISREERAPERRQLDLWWEAPAPLTDAADRTWTFELDPTWALRDVDGQRAAFDRLADEVLRRLGLSRGGRPWSRLRDELTGRASQALEEGVLAAVDRAGAPVRAVMASLRVGAIGAGMTWRFEARAGWPGGGVRYLGVDGHDQARFHAAWDPEGERTREADFAVDGAGRLVWFGGRDALTLGRGPWSFRATRELVHGLVRIATPRDVPGRELPTPAPAPVGSYGQ